MICVIREIHYPTDQEQLDKARRRFVFQEFLLLLCALKLQQKDVVEKPRIKNAPSNFAIIGRYILSTKIFSEIKKLKPGQGGEIHITDAIKSLIKKENKFYGNIFTGNYLDCGTLSGYINSGIQILKENK